MRGSARPSPGPRGRLRRNECTKWRSATKRRFGRSRSWRPWGSVKARPLQARCDDKLAPRCLPPSLLLLARGGELDRAFSALAAPYALPVRRFAVFHIPVFGDHDRPPVFLVARFGASRGGNNPGNLLAWRLARQGRRAPGPCTTLPGFRRAPGDRLDVVTRFVRKPAFPIEPVFDTGKN